MSFPTFTPTDTYEAFLAHCWPVSQTFGLCIFAVSPSVHTPCMISMSALGPSSAYSRTTLVLMTKEPSISSTAMGMDWKSRKLHMSYSCPPMLTSPRAWYDSSISLTRSIFTARKRTEHARKRRYIAHSFAPKSSRAAEGSIADKVELLIRKWDEIINKGPQFDGFTQLECRRWFT
jgi:hypothetical protein